MQASRMNSFGRALRLALAYRATFALSVFSALMVGVLWGGNIGTIYPFVEVAFHRQSMHDWIHQQVDGTQRHVEEQQAEIARLKAAGLEHSHAADYARHRLADYQSELKGWVWFRDTVVLPHMPSTPFDTLLLVVGVLLAGTLLKGLFIIAHQVLVQRLAMLATFRLRREFFHRSIKMDLATFSSEGSSDLMSRLTYDMENLTVAMVEVLGKLVREPLKGLVCLAGAAWISWQLLLFSLVLAPPAAWLVRALARALKRANRRAMEEMSLMYGILEEAFRGIKVVKAFTMERYERRRLHQNNKAFFRKTMHIAKYDSLSRPLTELIGILTICLALLAGAYLVLNDTTHLWGMRMSDEPLSLPLLLAFYGLLAGVSDPARKLSEVFSRIQRGAAAADRIYQLLDREPAIVDPPAPRHLPRLSQGLSLENVDFSYTPRQQVLKGINLHITCGESVAVVGPNGCGKSTLANLIPRFFDPLSGSVRFDGIDLRDVRLRDLRQQIGLVNQETLLFDDTVLSNIRYGSLHASREQAIEAARQAHAHEFIERELAEGYETVVGPHGGMLSGGQRQRIALARAILRDPAILILDEATSQVDLQSEHLIHKVLEQFLRNRTALVITHRMSTLALADRIVVMDAGQIVDVGTQEQLLRRCELFSRLYEIQFRQSA